MLWAVCRAARICTNDDVQAASICPAVRVCHVTVKQFDIKTLPAGQPRLRSIYGVLAKAIQPAGFISDK